jgi:pyruvate dehydrogenase E1 component alpha subunit
MGGHMHLFSREHLAASSGIVGAEGPSAAGFSLAAKYLRPGSLAVAFFGDGAMNQGMLMEAMNLASVWKLPVLFVCKDDNWAVTTRSSQVTGGTIPDRARGFGLTVYEADGLDVLQVWETVQLAIERIRGGQGPAFLHAKCVHLEGHFLGFQLLRSVRNPFKEMPTTTGSLLRTSLRAGGGRISQRLKGLAQISTTMTATKQDPREDSSNDPLVRARSQLQSDSLRLSQLETAIQHEIADILNKTAQECAA